MLETVYIAENFEMLMTLHSKSHQHNESRHQRLKTVTIIIVTNITFNVGINITVSNSYFWFRYLAYVLVGGACFMAIERPLEKKTCDEIEKQMQSGYAAFKSSTGKSLP